MLGRDLNSASLQPRLRKSPVIEPDVGGTEGSLRALRLVLFQLVFIWVSAIWLIILH